MKRSAIFVFACALAVVGTVPADAAIRKWSVEPSIYGALVKMDKDLDIDDTNLTGASLSLSITPAFQVEVLTSSLTSEGDPLGRPDEEYKQDMTGMRFIGTFQAEQEVRTMPYLAAGGGIIETTGDPGGNRPVATEEAGYAEVAAGVHVFLWKGLNVRSELGLRHARTIDITDHPTTHTNFYLSVGVSWFLFGSK